jgi:hypothetical protein
MHDHEITPKPDEVLQAQLAAFAAEELDSDRDRTHILRNLGELAVLPPHDIVRVAEGNEVYWDANADKHRVEAGEERTVATPGQYTAYLRSVGGSSHEGVRGRADLLKSYEKFAPEIELLRKEIDGMDDQTKHPAYLGEGASATVLRISHGDSDYAVRILRDPGKGAETIDGYVGGTIRMKGHPRFEQLEAISYKDLVTVAEIPHARKMNTLTDEEIRAIPDEHLEDLADALLAAHERGVEVDPKPDNFLYDPKQGYTLLDLSLIERPGVTSTTVENAGTMVGWMSDVIENTGYYNDAAGKYPDTLTAEDYAHNGERMQANVGVMIRYRDIVTRKLSGADLQTALSKLDKDIAESKRDAENYCSPEWVANTISEREKYKRRAAELSKMEFDTDITNDFV